MSNDPSSYSAHGDQETKSLFKLGLESLETVATNVFGLLISIPMLAITARSLGPDGRGAFVTTTTWSSLVATCCGFSLGLVAIHEMSKAGAAGMRVLLGTLLSLAVALAIIGWVLISVCYRIDHSMFGSVNLHALVLALVAVPLLIAKDYLGSLLIAKSRVRIWNRAQVAGNVLAVCLVAGLAGVDALTVVGIIIAWLLGQMAMCAVAFIDLYRCVGAPIIDRILACSLLKGGTKLHLNAIGSMLISSVDVLMVNSFLGTQEVGYYQLATKLIMNMALIAQAVAAVMYGRVVELGPDGAWTLVRRISIITMVVVTGGSLIAAWGAPFIINIIAGKSFAPSVPLFRLMLLAVPGLSLSFLMSPQWICRGYFWQAGTLTLFVAICNAVGNWLLVPRYGTVGAAASFIGIYVFSIFANGGMFLFCERRWRRSLSTIPGLEASPNQLLMRTSPTQGA